MIERGIFIGRFQPFHLGHLEATKYIMSEMDEVIIAIGSAQYSHTLDNPFTAGERLIMLRRALDAVKLDRNRYYLIPIEDVNRHSIWVAHVKTRTPIFKVAFTNEPLTKRLFMEAGVPVKPIPFFERNRYSSTEIRRRIVEGEDWRPLVPKAISDYIIEISGSERIKELNMKDYPSS